MSQNDETKPDFSVTCKIHPITVEIRKSNDCPVSICFGPGVLSFSISEHTAHDMADFLLPTGNASYYAFQVGSHKYEITWSSTTKLSNTYLVFERVGSHYPYQLSSSMAVELSEMIKFALSKCLSLSVTFDDSLEVAKKKTHENLRRVFG